MSDFRQWWLSLTRVSVYFPPPDNDEAEAVRETYRAELILSSNEDKSGKVLQALIFTDSRLDEVKNIVQKRFNITKASIFYFDKKENELKLINSTQFLWDITDEISARGGIVRFFVSGQRKLDPDSTPVKLTKESFEEKMTDNFDLGFESPVPLEIGCFIVGAAVWAGAAACHVGVSNCDPLFLCAFSMFAGTSALVVLLRFFFSNCSHCIPCIIARFEKCPRPKFSNNKNPMTKGKILRFFFHFPFPLQGGFTASSWIVLSDLQSVVLASCLAWLLFFFAVPKELVARPDPLSQYLEYQNRAHLE